MMKRREFFGIAAAVPAARSGKLKRSQVAPGLQVGDYLQEPARQAQ